MKVKKRLPSQGSAVSCSVYTVYIDGLSGVGGEVNRKLNFSLFRLKYIISRAVDKMAADSVAVERSL